MLVLAATAMGALRPTEASSSREDTMRDQIGQFLNMERTNRGLAPLPISAELQQQAQGWAEHVRDTGCTSNCHSTWSQGEIIAWGDPSLRSGGLVVAWMKSPDHRNVALYPETTAMGIGTACSDHGQEVAVVQYSDVYRPVAPTDEDPIATSEAWGSPCAGLEGPVPSTSTSTPMWHPTTTTTPTTAAPRPRPTTTTAPPRPRVAPPTTVKAAAVAATVAPTSTTASTSTSTTSTTLPRIGLRADGSEITTNAPPTPAEEAELFAQSAARPASAEPAWVSIVVVVVLLSGLRIGSQLRELRAARRLEDS
jgi:cysteine-rich secretory family protein